MSKIYAHDHSLKNIVDLFGWKLVGTNEEPDLIKKDHLLKMRRGPKPLVFDVMPYRGSRGYPGNAADVEKLRHKRIEGSEWNSNFYGITFEGLMVVKDRFPDMAGEVYGMLEDLLDKVFSGIANMWELEERGMPK